MLKSPFKKENTQPEPVREEPVQTNKSKRKFSMLESFDEFDSKTGSFFNSSSIRTKACISSDFVLIRCSTGRKFINVLGFGH